MSILNKFLKDGTRLDNDKIIRYDKQTKLNPKSFTGSELDLDGKSPKKYLDNPPQ